MLQSTGKTFYIWMNKEHIRPRRRYSRSNCKYGIHPARDLSLLKANVK